MSEIYVYDAKCEDFTSFGLVGALMPTSCVFEEEVNGMSEITLDHPMDDLEKYKALAINSILQVDVPVRTTPEIQDDDAGFVTSVWICKVQAGSSSSRTLYKSRTGSTKIKVLPAGHEVTVVKKYEEGRWKAKSKYGTGWISQAALSEETAVEIADKSQGIESVAPAWTVKPQLFRIYEVHKNIDSVTALARHITYDLLYQTTSYKSTESKTCKEALAGIFDNLFGYSTEETGIVGISSGFSAYTNLNNTYAGVDWERVNAINALLDPETGLTARYKATLVRDNWEMYFLSDPGMNRGITVEYARNMTGIEYIESTDEIATRIIPVGETKDGDPLLYKPVFPDGTTASPVVNYIDSPRIVTVDGIETPIVNAYPIPYTMVFECENCKVGSGGISNNTQAYQRMREQVAALYSAGIDLPKIEMSVDFINLGDTEEYRQFKNLERLFLCDYVRVRHKGHGLDVDAKIVSIKWDCLLDRMERMEIGSSIKTLANTQTFTPAGQYITSGVVDAISATGGTMTGALYLNGDPAAPLQAVTKQYVDTAIKNVSGGGSGGGSYSLEEVATGSKWIDGKMIYKKSVHIESAATNSTTNIPIGSGKIERLVSMHGTGLRGENSIRVLPYSSPTSSNNASLSLVDRNTDDPKISITTGSAGAVSDVVITVEYTKATEVT